MRIPVLPVLAPYCSSTAIYADGERESCGCTVETPNWLILAAGILFLRLVMKCADKIRQNRTRIMKPPAFVLCMGG